MKVTRLETGNYYCVESINGLMLYRCDTAAEANCKVDVNEDKTSITIEAVDLRSPQEVEEEGTDSEPVVEEVKQEEVKEETNEETKAPRKTTRRTSKKTQE